MGGENPGHWCFLLHSVCIWKGCESSQSSSQLVAASWFQNVGVLGKAGALEGSHQWLAVTEVELSLCCSVLHINGEGCTGV